MMLLKKYKLFIIAIFIIIIACIGIYFYKSPTGGKITSTSSYTSPTKDFGINPPSGWNSTLDLRGTSTPATSTRQYLSLGIPAIFSIGTTTPKLFENTDPVIFVTDRKIIAGGKYKDPADVSSVEEYANKIKNNFVPIILQPAKEYKLIEDEKVTLNDGTPAYLIGNSFDAVARIMPQPLATSSKTVSKNVPPVNQVGPVMHFRNLYLLVMKNSRLYVVTATADQSKWDEYKDSFKKTLLDFKAGI